MPPSRRSSTKAWIPLDYPSALAKFHGKPSRIDGKAVNLFETGTLIWRTQELYDLLVRELRKSEAATHLADQKADLQRALVYGGLMAHFVADAYRPHHNTADYDGFATGNGGVHSYFETDFPNTETPELEVSIDRAVSQAFGRLDELRKPALARSLGGRGKARSEPG